RPRHRGRKELTAHILASGATPPRPATATTRRRRSPVAASILRRLLHLRPFRIPPRRVPAPRLLRLRVHGHGCDLGGGGDDEAREELVPCRSGRA
ncbi:Os05g0379300, partial [Oryza sativa Japonica Group]